MVDLSLRRSGILLPLFSLPGSTGIGTMGETAFKFIDKLKASGQTYWQILPLGITGFGNSPYQCFSSYAGNPLFIDFDLLSKKGYLNKRDYSLIKWCDEETKINYETVFSGRKKVFHKLFENFKKNIPEDFYIFEEKEDYWLRDFSLFMSIKEANKNASFFSWENSKLKRRDKAELLLFEKENKEDILYHKMLQYFFFSQWYDLKSYANEKGINIIGDLPYYVSSDNAEVWANPENFSIDENFNIQYVAGCPPDNFSPDGQLWGNVIYNNDYIIKSGYKLWLSRFAFAKEMYDVIRIDHFKAFEAYYAIDFSENTAKNGRWLDGAGLDFFKTLKEKEGSIPIIAEDLGFKTTELRNLLSECGFPGMKILQFAFDGDSDNEYLPHNYPKNTVVYTGTHDNDTMLGFILSADKEKLKKAKEYLRTRKTTLLLRESIFAVLSSVSNLCIIPLQDLIGLDSSGRINIPSTIRGNWQWRCTHDQLKNIDYESLLRYTRLYGRTE